MNLSYPDSGPSSKNSIRKTLFTIAIFSDNVCLVIQVGTMIVYKVDKQTQARTSSHIRDMDVVLSEIAPTLQTLQDLLNQLASSVSSPSINRYREDLQGAISQTIVLANVITKNTQKLVSVTDQAAKHLSVVEEHFGSLLLDKQKQEQTIQV